ncbi:hypothetical protein BVC80_7055g3 [Macleaya cordata]|uniref:Uncharacterized protein n=1 Tax=Macleaya cordata TaxID=56857 RepID=A0A200PTP2_MACCD|nr:hypothetical protein BVC80_7055g3 [Macleaya cordata]
MDFKDLITLLAVVVVLFLSDKSSYGAEGRSLSKEEDMELERQLKILNKPPIKTIRVSYIDGFSFYS